MHAFLIVSKNSEKIENKLNSILSDHQAKRLDFPIQKIADVRDLKDFTKTSFQHKTAIVISDFNQASEDAQNALLKSLEEPQQNIIYILISNSVGGILPTILSRCELIETQDDNNNLLPSEEQQAAEFLEASTGDRLSLISKIKDRTQAIAFLNSLLVTGHKQLLNGQLNPESLTKINDCMLGVKANGNIQLQLTNMIVNLNK